MIMSWGLMRRFNMPIFGWSPRPRNNPGGSMRKLAMRSLWLSMMQKPNCCKVRSFSSLIFWKAEINSDECSPAGQRKSVVLRPTSFSSLVMAFRASDCALKYWCISEKLHFFRSVIFPFSSDVISCWATVSRQKGNAPTPMPSRNRRPNAPSSSL